MKRRIVYSIFLNIVCAAVLFSGCVKEPVATNPTESTGTLPTESIQAEASVPEEFSFIKLGETTLSELHEIRPDYHALRGSPEGAIVEYALQDGGYVQIIAQKEGRIIYTIRTAEESINVTYPEKEFYTMEDFASIVVGQSTEWDVSMICLKGVLRAAGFGAIQEIPMEGGGMIVIEFQGPGPDMYVRNIYVK